MVWDSDTSDTSPLYIWDLVATCLSFIGSSLMLYLCFKTPEKTVPMKMLVAIAIIDLLYSISNILSAFETTSNGFLCHVEAFLREFSLFLSVFMVTITAIICYKAARLSKASSQNRFLAIAGVFSVLVSIVLALSPVYIPQLAYQNAVLLCWVTASPSDEEAQAQLASILFQGLPVILCMLITLIGYIMAFRKIRKLPEMLVDRVGSKVFRLLWYPAILFITYIPGLVDVFLQTVKDPTTPATIQVMELIMTHCIGLTNAIIFFIQMRPFKKKKEPVFAEESFERPRSLSTSSASSHASEVVIQLQLAQYNNWQ